MAVGQRTLEAVGMNERFWKKKRVLLTGHTGFKGSWLSLWLQQLEAEVVGYALSPPTEPSLFEVAGVGAGMTSIIGDVRDLSALKKLFKDQQPEIVIHMAAQSLVRYSYQEPIETYETNVMGTLNVLESIRCNNSVRAALMVTSDKCYENEGKIESFRENDPMGGHDPYSSSKGCAELLISSYRNSYFASRDSDPPFAAIGSARAGNVIGGGDWATDRLIPDIIRAFQNDKPVQVRNPRAVRPWQHVLEPLSGYLKLVERLYTDGAEYAEAWNFGPPKEDIKPVEWIVEKMAKGWGNNASWAFEGGDHPYEANLLMLDSTKARARLSWQPQWGLEEALARVIEWHKRELAGSDLKRMCLKQIHDYTLNQGKSE